MELDLISFSDLVADKQKTIIHLETALLHKGIVGVQDVPDFEGTSRRYIHAAKKFSKLKEVIKQQYAPDRDAGQTEGYELGAEWFKNKEGSWQTDDKKASFYAFIPDSIKNRWPLEVDLKTPYLALGSLIFNTGKILLNKIGLYEERAGLLFDRLIGYGRMLHYHKQNKRSDENPDWCGAHVDHGLFTGLIPAYYFRNEVELEEPEEAGLYILPPQGKQFEKIFATDKNILLFQVGEFGQLLSNDRIQATKHVVRKAQGEIERFTFALFFVPDDNTVIQSNSILTQDERYKLHQLADGSLRYGEWHQASFERYRAKRA